MVNRALSTHRAFVGVPWNQEIRRARVGRNVNAFTMTRDRSKVDAVAGEREIGWCLAGKPHSPIGGVVGPLTMQLPACAVAGPFGRPIPDSARAEVAAAIPGVVLLAYARSEPADPQVRCTLVDSTSRARARHGARRPRTGIAI